MFAPVELPDPRSGVGAVLSMPEAQATAEQAIEASRRRVVPEALLIPAMDDAPTRRLEATRLRRMALNVLPKNHLQGGRFEQAPARRLWRGR